MGSGLYLDQDSEEKLVDESYLFGTYIFLIQKSMQMMAHGE
jgi:hypothetical protein